jgi:hypothetical protein
MFRVVALDPRTVFARTKKARLLLSDHDGSQREVSNSGKPALLAKPRSSSCEFLSFPVEMRN